MHFGILSGLKCGEQILTWEARKITFISVIEVRKDGGLYYNNGTRVEKELTDLQGIQEVEPVALSNIQSTRKEDDARIALQFLALEGGQIARMFTQRGQKGGPPQMQLRKDFAMSVSWKWKQ